MNDMKTRTFLLNGMWILLMVSCAQQSREKSVIGDSTSGNASGGTNQEVFWQELQKICGNTYAGTIVAGGENDTVFGNKALVMHVRACDDQRIRIPFFVGADSSRTWVLTLDDEGILLKHDHRHRDGSPDEVTMYGGKTSNFGASTMQFFPADQETADMLPAAIGNIWWIELVPGEYFSYNLRRVNTPRVFSVHFNLKEPIVVPGKPWGWED
jgi:hypothetical protein